MLPKKNRISKEDFERFFKKSRDFHSKHLTLRFCDQGRKNKRSSKELEEVGPKITFIVSKKISKKANRRNLLKRQGSAIIENHLEEMNDKGVFFFFFKKGSQTLSFLKLEEEILFLLKKTTTPSESL